MQDPDEAVDGIEDEPEDVASREEGPRPPEDPALQGEGRLEQRRQEGKYDRVGDVRRERDDREEVPRASAPRSPTSGPPVTRIAKATAPTRTAVRPAGASASSRPATVHAAREHPGPGHRAAVPDDGKRPLQGRRSASKRHDVAREEQQRARREEQPGPAQVVARLERARRDDTPEERE